MHHQQRLLLLEQPGHGSSFVVERSVRKGRCLGLTHQVAD
jgi:hypothetical protein